MREEQNNFNNEQEQTQQFIDDFINGLDEKEKAKPENAAAGQSVFRFGPEYCCWQRCW